MQLGNQTTADGLVHRSVGPPFYTPSSSNDTRLYIDQTNGNFYVYDSTNGWQRIANVYETFIPLDTIIQAQSFSATQMKSLTDSSMLSIVFFQEADTSTTSKVLSLPRADQLTGKEGTQIVFSSMDSTINDPYVSPHVASQMVVNGAFSSKYYLEQFETAVFTLENINDSLVWKLTGTTYRNELIETPNLLISQDKRYFPDEVIGTPEGAEYISTYEILEYNSGTPDSIAVFPLREKVISGENQMLGSEQINSSYYSFPGSPDDITPTDNDTTFTNGQLIAERLTLTGTADGRLHQNVSGLTEGVPYTFSFYAFKDTTTANSNTTVRIEFDGDVDAVSSQIAIDTVWTRYSVTMTSPTNWVRVKIYLTGDINDYLWMTRLQLEQGSTLSRYKQTTTTAREEGGLQAQLLPRQSRVEADFIVTGNQTEELRTAISYCSSRSDCNEVLAVKDRVLTDTIVIPEPLWLTGRWSGWTSQGSADWRGSGTKFYLNPSDSTKTMFSFSGNVQITGSRMSDLLLIPRNEINTVINTGNGVRVALQNIEIRDYESIGTVSNPLIDNGIVIGTGSIWPELNYVTVADFGTYGIEVASGNQSIMHNVRVREGPLGVVTTGGGSLTMYDCWGEEIDSSWIRFQGKNLTILNPTLESVPADRGSGIAVASTIDIVTANQVLIIGGELDGADGGYPSGVNLFKLDTVNYFKVLGTKFIRGNPLETTSQTQAAIFEGTTGPYPGAGDDWTGVYDRNVVSVIHTTESDGTHISRNILSNFQVRNAWADQVRLDTSTFRQHITIKSDTMELVGPQNFFPYSDSLTENWSGFEFATFDTTELVHNADSLNPNGVASNVYQVNQVAGTRNGIKINSINTLIQQDTYYNMSLWARKISSGGDGWVIGRINRSGNPDAETADTMTVTSSWQRLNSKILSPSASATSIDFEFSANDTFLIYGPQLGENELMVAYEATTGTSKLSSEVIFDGDAKFTGSVANIDSLKWTYTVATDGDTIPLGYNTYILAGDANSTIYVDASSFSGTAYLTVLAGTDEGTTLTEVGATGVSFGQFGAFASSVPVQGTGASKSFIYQDGFFRLIGSTDTDQVTFVSESVTDTVPMLDNYELSIDADAVVGAFTVTLDLSLMLSGDSFYIYIADSDVYTVTLTTLAGTSIIAYEADALAANKAFTGAYHSLRCRWDGTYLYVDEN